MRTRIVCKTTASVTWKLEVTEPNSRLRSLASSPALALLTVHRINCHVAVALAQLAPAVSFSSAGDCVRLS